MRVKYDMSVRQVRILDIKILELLGSCVSCTYISFIGSEVWLESGTLIFTPLVDVW